MQSPGEASVAHPTAKGVAMQTLGVVGPTTSRGHRVGRGASTAAEPPGLQRWFTQKLAEAGRARGPTGRFSSRAAESWVGGAGGK